MSGDELILVNVVRILVVDSAVIGIRVVFGIVVVSNDELEAELLKVDVVEIFVVKTIVVSRMVVVLILVVWIEVDLSWLEVLVFVVLVVVNSILDVKGVVSIDVELVVGWAVIISWVVVEDISFLIVYLFPYFPFELPHFSHLVGLSVFLVFLSQHVWLQFWLHNNGLTITVSYELSRKQSQKKPCLLKIIKSFLL